jgi:hypothetical protein
LHRLKTYTSELIGALANHLLILTRLVTFDSSLQKVSPIQHKIFLPHLLLKLQMINKLMGFLSSIFADVKAFALSR